MSQLNDTALQTVKIWNLFSKFTDEELNTLLDAAGVVPCLDRALKLHQALVVWFHGDPPNIQEIVRLSQALVDFKKEKL